MHSGAVGSHAEAYGTNPTRLDPPPNQEALQRRLWQDEMRPRVPALDAALHNGGRVLDVGCGPGLMLLQLAASYPNATFVGVDVVELGGWKPRGASSVSAALTIGFTSNASRPSR